MKKKDNRVYVGFCITIYILLTINAILKFDVYTFISSLIIASIIFMIYKFVNNKPLSITIYIITVLTTLGSILAESFNGIGILLFYLFLLICALTVMIRTNYRFEIALPVSASLLIFLFIIFGFCNILNYSIFMVLVITIICIIYIYKNERTFDKCIKNFNNTNFIIFSVLYLVAIIGGFGRYVHKWDEYSYWGYSAKVLIDTKSFGAFLSYMGTMNTYPPVSSIWHFIFSTFAGFSESNLYIGLTILDFIFLMPVFIKSEDNRKSFTVLLVIASFGFPLLLNGSISYGLLYVDLLLGFMVTSVMIIEDYLKRNNQSTKVIYIFLVLISLLKPNGFVVSCCLLFLFYIKDLMANKFSFIQLLKKVKKYIIPIISVFVIYVVWSLISTNLYNSDNSYIFKLIPKGLSTSISLKLESSFILSYLNSLVGSIDDIIIYAFVQIPLFAFLIAIFFGLYKVNECEDKQNLCKSLLPYLLFYLAFFMLTALSLFVMFTYYEASKLASFSRYLNPIHIALALFLFYKLSYVFKEKKSVQIVYIIVIVFVGFGNLTYFVTDIKARRDTMRESYERQDTFRIVNKKTPENSKVFIINQKDEDSIMPIWYARYYCYPRVVNANPSAISWKIRTKSNKWDLKKWGLNKETFANHLSEYSFDYVYFYTSTRELYYELQDYFVDYKLAKKSKLFKIIYYNNTIKLEPIKEKNNG